MKKSLIFILTSFILFFLLSTTVFGESILIQHSVEVISEFNVKSKNISKFSGSTAIEVAEISVKNNTRDGYQVLIQTTNGALHSNTNDNGETDIPYVFSKSQSGTVPAANSDFIALTVPQTPPTTPTIILGATSALTEGSLLSEPTDLEFSIKVSVSNTDFINMAGTYSDTITISYVDL